MPGKESDYVKFEIKVTQDINAKQSLATPWFGQKGEGVQIQLDGQIKELIENKKLKTGE